MSQNKDMYLVLEATTCMLSCLDQIIFFGIKSYVIPTSFSSFKFDHIILLISRFYTNTTSLIPSFAM